MPDDLDAIERRIAEAEDRVKGCRRAIVASRAVLIAGATVLLLALVVAALRTPTVVFAAVAAVIGGTVWGGASAASLGEALAEHAALDAVRSRMIDEVATRNGWRDLTPTVH